MAIFASVTDYVKNGLPADNWMRESTDYPKKGFIDWDEVKKKHKFDEIKDKSVRESARWLDGLVQIWDFTFVSVYFPTNPYLLTSLLVYRYIIFEFIYYTILCIICMYVCMYVCV